VTRTISLPALRALVVSAQGYAVRERSARPGDVAAAIARLSAVQLDSISTVERSHRLTLLCRTGRYPRGTVSSLLGSGRIFEYWAHEACLLPIDRWPVWRRRMLGRRMHHWYGPVIDSEPELAARVLSEIRERGPLGSRHFEGARPQGRWLWGWKPAKRMLEALWTAGELVVCARQGFQRLYDLPERVIPDHLLGAPVPGEDEFLARIAEAAVLARGALTASGVVEHNRLKGGVARIRPHLDRLCAEGRLERLAVADGGADVYVPAGAQLDAAPTACTLLSPFDNLLWDRPFAQRVLGFAHLIEVYKRPHERRFGYYVLPFLERDRIVGRADLKADRERGELIVRAYHPEPGLRRSAGRERAFARACARLARQLGLERVVGVAGAPLGAAL
jgi:uncharacterized protein YcaQ